MKNLITCLFVLLVTLGFSQSKSSNNAISKNTVKVESMSLTIEVDSAEELKSTFKLEDLSEIFSSDNKDESYSLKIICNGEKMSNGVKSHISYKVEGNSADTESFFKRVELIRDSALSYYNNKN